MTERRRSKRLNSNPRAERYETRNLRSMITELRSNRLAATISSHLTHYGSEDGAVIPLDFPFQTADAQLGAAQQKYFVLRDSSALMTNNKMFPGAEFTETAIKKEYRLALGRVCSEPERDTASVEIEWKDNEKEHLPVLLFSAKGARHVAIRLENKTTNQVIIYCRKNKKELESCNIMETLMKASVIGVKVAH
ncbi:hypothetical protein B0H14DRAFT_2922004 [Mycena olivaceomarginata]|nr:hypothetical protein B0H14DRAFT_2922004 [Mycena olivaceomarginata]